jgi:uncharacterized caspase-like protein
VLDAPKRDADAVAAALRQSGFQTVTLATDLDRDHMVKALRAFRDEADKADWALVYFAGHGIAVNGVNYLIPVDAKLADDRDVTDETVSHLDLLKTIGGAGKLRVLILDACRNNPFQASMRRTGGTTRDPAARGLVAPQEREQTPGTLIIYAAKEGQVALDNGGDGNSPFARAFMNQIKVPGREIRYLVDYVRDDVMTATAKRQEPWTYGSLPSGQDFFFVSAKGREASAGGVSPTTTSR